jgi:hypothetical protein
MWGRKMEYQLTGLIFLPGIFLLPKLSLGLDQNTGNNLPTNLEPGACTAIALWRVKEEGRESGSPSRPLSLCWRLDYPDVLPPPRGLIFGRV